MTQHLGAFAASEEDWGSVFTTHSGGSQPPLFNSSSRGSNAFCPLHAHIHTYTQMTLRNKHENYHFPPLLIRSLFSIIFHLP